MLLLFAKFYFLIGFCLFHTKLSRNILYLLTHSVG